MVQFTYFYIGEYGIKAHLAEHRGARACGGVCLIPNWSPRSPLPCLFPGLFQERSQPTVPQASPQVTPWAEGPMEPWTHSGMPVRTVWGVQKSCNGILGTKRRTREGSQWFGGTHVGKKREKRIKGTVCGQTGCWSAACPGRACPYQRHLSCLHPEHCYQPFLNMNKDA